MYSITFTKEAKKDLYKLDNKYQKSVQKAIEKLRQNPKVGSPLRGRLRGYWKLRFSRYKIIYKIQEKKLIIVIFSIDHRRKVYKRFSE